MNSHFACKNLGLNSSTFLVGVLVEESAGHFRPGWFLEVFSTGTSVVRSLERLLFCFLDDTFVKDTPLACCTPLFLCLCFTPLFNATFTFSGGSTRSRQRHRPEAKATVVVLEMPTSTARRETPWCCWTRC